MFNYDNLLSVELLVDFKMSKLCGFVRLLCIVSSLDGVCIDKELRGSGGSVGYFGGRECEAKMSCMGFTLYLSEGICSSRRELI